MQAIAARAGKPGTATDGGVPESAIAGVVWGDGCERVLADLQCDLLPALSRQWVEAEATIRGHVWYRLTDAGRAVATGGTSLPVFGGPPRRARGGGTRYCEAYAAARARIDALRPAHPGELGIMPVSMSRPTVDGGRR
jgi:hypothetical protein